jgi:hypothetical protein
LQQANPGNATQLMAVIREDNELAQFEHFGGDSEKQAPATNFWPRVFLASGGTGEGILNLIRETEPLYERLINIMALPLPEYNAQVQPYAAEIRQSQNPFVQLLFPDPLRPRPRELKIQAYETKVRAAVTYKLHGEAGLNNVADPLRDGPFALERFVFEGADRGFELKSAYTRLSYPCALIFVEKEGPAFHTDGPYIGQAIKP